MKQTIILLLIISLPMTAAFGEDEVPSGLAALYNMTQQIEGAIRLGGGAGYTFEYDNDSWDDRLSYGGSIQGLWIYGNRFVYVGAGLDLSYYHFYRETGDNTRAYTYQAVNAMGELNISLFTLQLGIGPHYYHGDESDIRLGMFLSAGLNFTIYESDTGYITLPVMVRSQYIFVDGTAISVGIYTGLTFYICGD